MHQLTSFGLFKFFVILKRIFGRAMSDTLPNKTIEYRFVRGKQARKCNKADEAASAKHKAKSRLMHARIIQDNNRTEGSIKQILRLKPQNDGLFVNTQIFRLLYFFKMTNSVILNPADFALCSQVAFRVFNSFSFMLYSIIGKLLKQVQHDIDSSVVSLPQDDKNRHSELGSAISRILICFKSL